MRTQLRIRTEYSFGQVYGQLPKVIDRLAAIGTKSAGMVEIGGSTWGHVQWDKQCRAADITPMFGAEFIVRRGEDRPVCWVLAEDTSALYRMTTEGFTNKYYGATTTEEALAASKGLIRFAGAALTDPDTFDYIDINPASRLQRHRALQLHKLTGKPLVVTSDNFYPSEKDREAFLLIGKSDKPSPQHILDRFPDIDKIWLRNADEIAERLANVKLHKAPMIHFEGDLAALVESGKKERLSRGQIKSWSEIYEARLEREMELIHEKDFESYFLVVSDMVRWAKQRMLVGPARGSAAGSLVCYLIGITEVDPLPYGLIFERFIDVTRKDLPDIDLDFPDSKRDLVYGYLEEKYGKENVARIGTINAFKPKSALALTAKKLGVPPYETYAVKDAMFIRSSGDSRANDCLMDTLMETEPGRDLMSKCPSISLASKLESHASHTGVHAAGVIVCNEPISNFGTVYEGVLQLDKYDIEALNLLKIDALGLRTLGVIEDAGVVTQDELYQLTFDDPQTYKLFGERKYAGVFQWEGPALQSVSNQLTITKFSDLDHITALARPGPLGGGAATRYIERHEGREQWEYPHPSLGEYLDESFGIVLYQEQVLRLCREIGGMSWDDATLLRKAMSKSYGKEYFDKFGEKFITGAAAHGISAKDAESMWDQINSMGMWSFNKAHSVSYAVISYWTAWLKTHHPIEYAAASLRNAKDDEAVVNILRELNKEGVPYVAFDVDRSDINWSAQDGTLVGGFMNLVGFVPAKSVTMVEKRRLGILTDKDFTRISAAEIKFKELYPVHQNYGDIYLHPDAHGIKEGTKVLEIRDFPEEGEVVFICRLLEKDKRDENETVRVARRNGKIVRGNSLFADAAVVDDSTSTPITLRIDRFNWHPYGMLFMERAKEGKDYFLVRGKKIKGFPMVKMLKIRCLTNEGMFIK